MAEELAVHNVAHITVACEIHNPNREVVSLDKITSAAMLGLDLAFNDGSLVPADKHYEVAKMYVQHAVYSDVEDGILTQDDLHPVPGENPVPETPEKAALPDPVDRTFTMADLLNPRRVAELQVQAIFADVETSLKLLPTQDAQSLRDHLLRFCQAHGLITENFKAIERVVAEATR